MAAEESRVLQQQNLNIPMQINQKKLNLKNHFMKIIEALTGEIKNSHREMKEKTE